MSISVKPASLRRFLRGVDVISLSTYLRWVGFTRPWTIFGSLATFRQALNCPSGRPLHRPVSRECCNLLRWQPLLLAFDGGSCPSPGKVQDQHHGANDKSGGVGPCRRVKQQQS